MCRAPHLMGRFLPSNLATMAIMSFMDTISVEPRFRTSRKSDLVMRRMP